MIWIDGVERQIDFVADIPERVTGIIAMHRGTEEIIGQTFGNEQGLIPYKEGQRSVWHHAQLSGEEDGHIDPTCSLTTVSSLNPLGAYTPGQTGVGFRG